MLFLQNFYGGAVKSERAARIIQEAYRSYRMKNQFDKIKHSRTRRLTLDAISPASQRTISPDQLHNRSKSLDSAGNIKIVLEECSVDANQNGYADVTNAIALRKMESSDTPLETHDETLRDPTDTLGTEEEPKKDAEEDSSTPRAATPVKEMEDIKGLTEEEVTKRIMYNTSPVNLSYVRRRKKHG